MALFIGPESYVGEKQEVAISKLLQQNILIPPKSVLQLRKLGQPRQTS